ncbi:uncharacterized protein [Drosophila pseudoobscura]|uniref:Uncharacterized protein n=1 Tax=Drosophila pseudoobscura pseudoobscura TaxID=46245 RepID=A0A6I8VMY7_DROPS|nr:uncharacterized protein LOC26532025 [Drosophila pseudoobscura]
MRSMTAAPVTGATSPCATRDMIQGARGSVLLPGRPLGPSTAIALPSTPCCFLRLSSPLAVGTFSAVYAAVALRPLGRSKGCVPGWTVTGCLAAGHSYDAAASSISRPCPCSAGT